MSKVFAEVEGNYTHKRMVSEEVGCDVKESNKSIGRRASRSKGELVMKCEAGWWRIEDWVYICGYDNPLSKSRENWRNRDWPEI